MTVSEDDLSRSWMGTAAGAVLSVFPAPLVIEEYHGAAVWSYSTPARLSVTLIFNIYGKNTQHLHHIISYVHYQSWSEYSDYSNYSNSSVRIVLFVFVFVWFSKDE